MAISANGKLLLDNKLLLSTTVLSSNVSVQLPLDNMKSPQRARAAQLGAVSNVQIGIDLGSSPPPVSAVAWVGTNLRNGATVEIRRNTVNTYASGTVVTTVATVQPVTIAGGTAFEYVNFALFDPLTFRYWWLTLNDAGNPDGFLRLGVVFVGAFFELAANFNDSDAPGILDESSVEYAPSGTPLGDSRPPVRTLSFDYSGLADADLWGGLYRLAVQVGVSRQIWVIPYPLASGSKKNELALYGRFSALPRFAGDGPATWSASNITIRESL